MKTNLTKPTAWVRVAAIGYVSFSALSLLSVSLMAFASPQAVMDLVGVRLPNTDAYSSIRGVYGGVGLTIALSVLYLLRTHVRQAVGFLTLLWGSYALSRAITMGVEGPLGAFGTQWMIIETGLFIIGLALLWLTHNRTRRAPTHPATPAPAHRHRESLTLFLAPVPPPPADPRAGRAVVPVVSARS